jgi:hypothetical protein
VCTSGLVQGQEGKRRHGGPEGGGVGSGGPKDRVHSCYVVFCDPGDCGGHKTWAELLGIVDTDEREHRI